MQPRRLNLPSIESTLRSVQREFPRVNRLLEMRRDALDDEVLDNMMAGYAFVDEVIGKGLDLLSLGSSKHLLELNTLVLCGADPGKRALFSEHIAATEQHFYEQPLGGVRDVTEWYQMHQGESVWKRAACVYIRMLSRPQLFIEGNHRAGALVMSYLLAREGRPPFVLTVDNARGYFDPSSLVKRTKKRSITMLVWGSMLKRRFAELLRESTDDSYLIPAQ